MADHPDTTIVLMDVDCTVHGSLDPLLAGDGDIAIYIRAKSKSRVHCSSRVVVFRPTPATHRLLTLWKQKCDDAISALSKMHISRRKLLARGVIAENDERLLMEAIAATPELTMRLLPMEHAANAEGRVGNALVTHDSAHDKDAPPKGPSIVKRARRRLTALFRDPPKPPQYKNWS